MISCVFQLLVFQHLDVALISDNHKGACSKLPILNIKPLLSFSVIFLKVSLVICR